MRDLIYIAVCVATILVSRGQNARLHRQLAQEKQFSAAMATEFDMVLESLKEE